MHYLILDTNVYRELGVAFTVNIDFGYFHKFVERSPHEILMLEIVQKEFSDFFKKDYISSLIKEYEKIYLKFDKNPYIDNLPLADLTIIERKAKETFEQALKKSCWKIIKAISIDSALLTDFLLYNKRLSNKDNTRDFLILINILEIAKTHKKDKVVFITRDKIFRENDFFKKTITTSNIENLEIVDSIAAYLSEYSAKISFIDDDNVLKSISIDSIRRELFKDIDCFPSYISSYYHDIKAQAPQFSLLEIKNIKLKEYYTFSEDKIKTVIVSTLIVSVKIIYEAETAVQLKDYPKERYHTNNHNRIDSFNRPIYENDILFIYKGQVDKTKKKISRQKFIDFIPDWNLTD
jgi:hypothetical protein